MDWQPIETGLPEAPRRWLCEECGETGFVAELNTAPHPFRSDETVVGCPHCGGLDVSTACFMDGCRNVASQGISGAFGYRYVWCCHKHAPEPPNYIRRLDMGDGE